MKKALLTAVIGICFAATLSGCYLPFTLNDPPKMVHRSTQMVKSS